MIFDVIKGEPVINPEALFIPGFKEVWQSDKTTDKVIATQKLLYIYHSRNPRSSYSLLGPDREAEVIKDFLAPFDITVDEELTRAAERYSDPFLKDAGVRFLEGIEVAVNEITKMLKNPDTYSSSSKVKFSDIKDIVVKGSDLLSSYYKLRKQVEEGLQEDVKYRGGGEPSLVEDFTENG